MRQVNVKEAQSRLSDLIESAVRGEKILVIKDDQQAVELVPVKFGKRIFGSAKGLIEMAEDFDAPLEDFKDYM